MGIVVEMVLVRAIGVHLEELSQKVRVIDLKGKRTVFSVWRLARYIRRNHPDAVLSGLDTANFVNVIACFVAGRPRAAVISQRAGLSDGLWSTHSMTRRLVIWLFGYAYRQARAVIANSERVGQELLSLLRIEGLRMKVIHNFVDVDAIQHSAKAAVDHPWASLHAPPLVLLVGSLTARKNIQTAMRAFAEVRKKVPCNMIVIGEGPERQRLERLAGDLGIRDWFQLAGFDPNPFRWMKRATVLVSSSRLEGCPNVILQALACGTSVVATDEPGGTREILGDGAWGQLVPVEDAECMARAILRVVSLPQRTQGEERARMFDPLQTMAAYLEVLFPEGIR